MKRIYKVGIWLFLIVIVVLFSASCNNYKEEWNPYLGKWTQKDSITSDKGFIFLELNDKGLFSSESKGLLAKDKLSGSYKIKNGKLILYPDVFMGFAVTINGGMRFSIDKEPYVDSIGTTFMDLKGITYKKE